MRMLPFFAILLLCSASVFAAEGNFYEFVVSKDGSALNAGDVVLKSGMVPVSISDFSDYRLAVVDVEGKKLYESGFTFNSDFIGETFGETGSIAPIEVGVSLSSIVLSAPYFPAGQYVIIYDATGAKVLEIPVLHFANLCSDGICQDSESYESCPSDCPSGSMDDFCDSVSDGRCDPDCNAVSGVDADCATAENGDGSVSSVTGQGGFASRMRMLVILGGVIVTVSAAVVLFARLRNRGEADSV